MKPPAKRDLQTKTHVAEAKEKETSTKLWRLEKKHEELHFTMVGLKGALADREETIVDKMTMVSASCYSHERHPPTVAGL